MICCSNKSFKRSAFFDIHFISYNSTKLENISFRVINIAVCRVFQLSRNRCIASGNRQILPDKDRCTERISIENICFISNTINTLKTGCNSRELIAGIFSIYR